MRQEKRLRCFFKFIFPDFQTTGSNPAKLVSSRQSRNRA